MKTIRLRFVNFPATYNPKTSLFYEVISRHFVIDMVSDPDYVIFGHGGAEHVHYDQKVKILFLAENSLPDFNAFDYAMGMGHANLGDRYLRLPLYAVWKNGLRRWAERQSVVTRELTGRKFCSFVVSNAQFGDPMRKKFFERLSKYKRVDSGGRWMNNVGGPVDDKIGFCSGYKFNIAFENSSSPGYVTEKIMEAYVARTVPIYYGDPTVETDFRLESMVRLRGESDIERAVDEVVALDRDDDAYLKKVTEPCLAYEDPKMYEKRLEAFLLRIFEQPLDMARRRCFYGHQQMMREHMRKLMAIDGWIGKARRILHV